MRKKGGQRLMEMAREKSPPVIEETVKRYTDTDRFEEPIMHDVGPIDEELPPAPPAPARRDLVGKMFPRLSAAMDLFGKIDLSRIRQARGDAGRRKVDEAAGAALMDSVLVGQLADLENRLSLENLPKNLPQIKRKLDERHLGGVLTPIDEKKATQAILKRLQANRTKSDDPEVRKAEKLAEIEAKDQETLAELAQIEIPIMAFDDVELESLLPQFDLEVPSAKNMEAMRGLAQAYVEVTGEVRTPLQLWVAMHHPEMDQAFFDWVADVPEE
jgi:ribosomal protein S10